MGEEHTKARPLNDSDEQLRVHALWCLATAEALGHRFLDGTSVAKNDGLRDRLTFRCTRCESLLIVLAGEGRPSHHWGSTDHPCATM